MPKLLCDIIRWVLIIGATVLAVKWLWTVHWVLGLVLALPVFLIFLNVFGFLTLPLYGFTTEARIARRVLKDLEEKGSEPKQERDTH